MRIFVLGLLLIAQALAYTFPYGKCFERSCSAAPFHLTWSVQNVSHLCFRLDPKDRNKEKPDPYGCFQTLRKGVPKIVLETKPRCEKAIKVVSVNDKPKKGGIYFTNYEKYQSELVITNLSGVNASTVICMKVDAPCQTVSRFCRKGGCRYSLYEPVQHDCCPTCAFSSTSINETVA